MAEQRSVPCCPSLKRIESREVLDSHGGVTFSVEAPCEEEPRRLLDACFLCRRPLRGSSDVFMYRGDTPFCSEDCRQEQIDIDGAREWELGYCRRTHRRRASLLAELPRPPQGKATVAG